MPCPYLLIIAAGMITAMKIKDGFGKLLASGLVFTMAFQVFTVVGGITLVIPLTGLTMPYMAAGGSSLIANYVLAALLVIMSNAANKPQVDTMSDTFRMEALSALQQRQQQKDTSRHSGATATAQVDEPGHTADMPVVPLAPRHGAHAAPPAPPVQDGEATEVFAPLRSTDDTAGGDES